MNDSFTDVFCGEPSPLSAEARIGLKVRAANHHAIVLEVVGMISVAIGAGLVGFARRHSR